MKPVSPKRLRTKLFLIGAGLACMQPCFAQQKKIPDSLSHLYELAEYITYDKFYREHLPLDGDKVPAIPFRRDSLYGFVDKVTRKWTIEPRFTQVFTANEDGAIVEVKDHKYGEGTYGLVAYDGHFLIPAIHQELYPEGNFYHGVRLGVDQSLDEHHQLFYYSCWYDRKGKLLIEAKAHEFHPFISGSSLAWTRYGTQFSVFDTTGKLRKKFAVDFNRHFVGTFNDELVFAEHPGMEDQRYTGYDLDGNKRWSIPSEQHATAVFRMSADVFGFLTESGLILTDAKGNEAPYSIQNDFIGNGFERSYGMLAGMDRIPVLDQQTQKTGYIDRNGKLVIPCKYFYGGYFVNGEAPVMDSMRGLIGFINARGEQTVKPFIPYDNLEDQLMSGMQPGFSDGLCMVEILIPEDDGQGHKVLRSEGVNGRIHHRIAYYDRQLQERILLPDSAALAGPFSDGRAFVVTGAERQLGFIDTSGKMVIPARYELAVAGAYPVPQIVTPVFIHGYAYLKSFKGYIGKDGYEYFSGKRVQDRYDFSH